MENSPFSPLPNTEAGSKPSESEKNTKKDSKKSKAIGSLTFERPATADKTEEKPSLAKLLETQPADKKSAEKSPEPAAETTATKPELSAEDADYVLYEVAAERQAEVASEPIEDDVEAQAAHAAAEEFYTKLVDEGLPLEVAAAEMMGEQGSSEEAPETPPQTVEEADEAEPVTTTKPVTPAAATGGSGGSTPPPRSPATPSGPASHNPVPPREANTPLPVYANPNTPPIVTRTEYVPYYDRSRAFGDALVGGIVGYLIGRRRGRIKTERKLLPIQHKLEQEVSSLTARLATTEFTIREAAKQKVREQAAAPKAETVVSIHDQKAASEGMILGLRERPLPAPELHTKPNFVPPSERIGKVVIAAEALRAPTIETVRPTHEVTRAKRETIDMQSAERQVETLSRNELMTLSEKVIVEGSTLRQVYETNLISERGLRRLITEYLRGGDVVKAFRRELVEREIDFERDPKLRDTVRKNLTGGGASPTLNKLLQQAGVAPQDDSPQQLAQARAQQLRDAKQQSRRMARRKVMDVSLATIIAVLIAIIAVLVAHKI